MSRLLTALVGPAAAIVSATGDPLAGPASGVTTFDETGLHVAGVPFFPFGLLWFDAEDVESYRGHGLNVVYAEGRNAMFEAAAAAGLHVIAHAPDEARVHLFAPRPELIAWWIMDDAASVQDSIDCARKAAFIRRYDRGRPVIASLNGRTPALDRRFTGTLDVPVPYDYPLPRMSFEAYAEWLETFRRGTGTDTFWTTIQSSLIYSKHRALGFTDVELARALEPAQLRLLVWTVISHGARGIFLWPRYGLFGDRTWAEDRRAEVGILGSEIDVVSRYLVEGHERRDGASASHADVHVCRLDRNDESLLVLTKLGPRYHLAVDSGLALDVEVRVSGAAGLHAWAVSFPDVRALPTHRSGADLVVELDEVELTELVLLSSVGRSADEIRADMQLRLPRVAEFAERSAQSLAEKVGDTLQKLLRLGATPPGLALPFGDDAAVSPSGDRSDVERYVTARRRARAMRELGARCRDHADRFLPFAAAEAAVLRMTVATLPAYFSSFDVVEARRILEAPGRAR